MADALSIVSPQPTPKEGEDEEDFIPVHMITEEIAADSTRVGDFRRATAENTISGLLCQTFSRSQQRETLLPHEVPQGPWEKLGINFFEFQFTTYLLVADYYSRFPVIRKVRSTNASATTEILKQVFSEYGVPQTVMTDNGPPFSSKEFAAFANQ